LTRYNLLIKWITQFLGDQLTVELASSDASFRRYFRVTQKGKSYIVMDAPPDKESISEFIAIGKKLFKDNINVPDLYEVNINDGFILMSDFGNTTYLEAFSFDDPLSLYRVALDSLFDIQNNCHYENLPSYSESLLAKEMRLFHDWYLIKYKKIILKDKESKALDEVIQLIVLSNLNQPQLFVHRDFHCRNLMFIDRNKAPGIIDFQDAVNGPITYDLASLLKDAYYELEEDLVIDLLVRYWGRLKEANLIKNNDFSDFYKSFEWMGVQRHMKILGIFVRLSIRDGKDQYLDDIRLVENYLLTTTKRYSVLFPLRNILMKGTEL
jgi:aminoglycoside/choline kinase family phosphotransferase